MTKIKLCGMIRPEDIHTANRLAPDLVGFVFARKSRRFVSGDVAAKLREELSDRIQAVGVFVNEDIGHILELLDRRVIDAVQLHGDEGDEYINDLCNKTDVPVIRACHIQSPDDIAKIRIYPNVKILLDAGSGDGQSFSWDWLKDVDFDYYLAGGLDPQNVGEAVRTYHPYGVDVSSGIETDGYKDPDKMEAFVRAVREGER